MTTISATVVAHSSARSRNDLVSLQLRYPRFIHAELMTHRVFSRNARSSRAVPVERMIRECLEDPVIPLHWGKAQPGMQADEEHHAEVMVGLPPYVGCTRSRENAWLSARDEAVRHATAFMKAGYAKQLVNRLLEPFLHVDVLVTSTEWENFFKLRLSPLAEPHMRMLAKAMKAALDASTPILLSPWEWHTPYVTADEKRGLGKDSDWSGVLSLSAARSARISYRAYDGSNSSAAQDRELHDKLVLSKHWSPLEHQARPDLLGYGGWANPGFHGNLRGWVQYRQAVEKGPGS